MSDPILDLIARLPATSVAPQRARRTQARCHRALARRSAPLDKSRWTRWRIWSPAVLEVAVLYLGEALRAATRVNERGAGESSPDHST